MWRPDDYVGPVRFPAGLGYEAAGTVDAVGSNVTGFVARDAVNVIPSFSMNQYSTYGEVIVKHPESLCFAQAASIWMMFVTAYGALIEDAKITKGDFVVIPAASSSVGLAAITHRDRYRNAAHATEALWRRWTSRRVHAEPSLDQDAGRKAGRGAA
jgi:NADPH:quinone reductase-like Zn-dependent oxidoreductase